MAGYVALLRRLRVETDHTVYAPAFDRSRELALAGAIAVRPEHRLVVTEGNYLLYDAPGWSQVRSVLDEVWFVEADEQHPGGATRSSGTSRAAAPARLHSVGPRCPTRPMPIWLPGRGLPPTYSWRWTSTMTQLDSAHLAELDPASRTSRATTAAEVTTGIVHFGVGGFHRAHQAMYLDTLMREGKALDWGITGVGVLPGDQPHARRAACAGLSLHAGGEGRRRHDDSARDRLDRRLPVRAGRPGGGAARHGRSGDADRVADDHRGRLPRQPVNRRVRRRRSLDPETTSPADATPTTAFGLHHRGAGRRRARRASSRSR